MITPHAAIASIRLATRRDAPVALIGIDDHTLLGRTTVGLVEVFTADEQRARTSQALFRSAIGERVRPLAITRDDAGDAEVVTVEQHDEKTGLIVRTTLTHPAGTSVIRIETELRNDSDEPIIITGVTSATIGFGQSAEELQDLVLWSARSEWVAEDRWHATPLGEVLPQLNLALHGQDGRGHFSVASHGSWSSGEHLPTGAIGSASSGEGFAWQIEGAAGWQVDLCQQNDGGVISLSGPSDLEHHFAHELLPGATFTATPVAVAVSSEGPLDALSQLTAYRRWLRRDHRPADDRLPIVYNDFMNTLMGQPSTEALEPLIDAAQEHGAEVFCIDAGWFADPAIGDWWDTVGEWREDPSRFTHGLRPLIDRIHAAGMISGLWIEPEAIGVRSRAAETLPDEAFFCRFGRRVREHDRYHLDFRHPAARAHVDDAVDRMVHDYGIGFLKIDYNINPGAGTDVDATGAGDGLLGHSRAFAEWLVSIQDRHPNLLVENCSSGAMRADYSLLSVTHMQSTSDQQDFRLYPPIAASAPASILPEQCGNWAYPESGMTDEETAFTMVTGLCGRLYLAGFLDQLRSTQNDLVSEATALHRMLRGDLRDAIPSWPLGLPSWDDEAVCLALTTKERTLIFVWDRAEAPGRIQVPVPQASDARVLYPASTPSSTLSVGAEFVEVETPRGLTARVIEVRT